MLNGPFFSWELHASRRNCLFIDLLQYFRMFPDGIYWLQPSFGSLSYILFHNYRKHIPSIYIHFISYILFSPEKNHSPYQNVRPLLYIGIYEQSISELEWKLLIYLKHWKKQLFSPCKMHKLFQRIPKHNCFFCFFFPDFLSLQRVLL